jgi:hypothetical protein
LCLYVVLSCVGRDLCDRLITRPEESYLVSNYVKSGHITLVLTQAAELPYTPPFVHNLHYLTELQAYVHIYIQGYSK